MAENPWQPPFRPGTLRDRILEATEHGRATGALQPIPTSFLQLEDHGIPFVVRVVDSLRRKQQARQTQGKTSPENPFLPCDADLYVADVSDTHVAVLNKFNVMDHHLLVVTREFEHQERLLTAADFHALWRCLREVDGLGFYNGGVVAGASQQHKHLQLAPFPLSEGIEGLPVDRVVIAAIESGRETVTHFPFRHAVAACDPSWCSDPHAAACASQDLYARLLEHSGLRVEPGMMTPPSYNLLVTRRWMMVVPRSQETFEGISINAIGYAGGLLVRNEEELGSVREAGPMRVLETGGVPSGG
jgi:ATP adenylyltransferase